MRTLSLNNGLSILDNKTNFYTEEYYLHRLSEERLRAERANSTLSLITIDVQPSLRNGSGKIIPDLARLLHNITRKTDIKAWYQEDKLAILMPDTSRDGAIKLAKKISHEMKETINGKLSKGIKTVFKIYTYGKNHSESSCVQLPLQAAVAEAGQLTCKTLFQGKGTEFSEVHFSDILYDPPSIPGKRLQKAVKRAIDITGSLIGIILALPLFIIISVIIKLTSPGPILFKQERNGYRGKKFTFLKFRSMYHNTGDDIHRQYVLNLIKESKNKDTSWTKLNDDPRITPFGKFLRKTSLDELPQLFNVLKGDMSLVGPRPPIPYEVDEYQLWHWKRTLQVKPGITGLWQVEGRGCSTFNCMVRLDLSYINNWSLWLDLKILFKTFYVVFTTRGAS